MATGNDDNSLIINVALTGCVATTADNEYLPVTSAEIASNVVICAQLGAQIFHIHVRDEQQRPTWKRECYQDIVNRIRQYCPDVIICVSCSGRYWNELDKRSEALKVNGVDMASLTLGSFNFKDRPSVNALADIRKLLEIMNTRNIKPELEVFDLGMVDVSKMLIKDGLLKPPFYYNLFFGNQGTLSANIFNVALVINSLPDKSVWSIAGIGKSQFEMNCLGVVSGGHIRTGLEDNLKYDQDTKATNESLVTRLVKFSGGYGRNLMGIKETRKCLNII